LRRTPHVLLVLSVLLSLAAGGLTGCGGPAPLDYETAMSVMRDRTMDPVRISFSASPHFENQDPRVSQAYQKLIIGHVIECKTNTGVGNLCEPGPAGDALTQNGVTDLTLVAGRWTPSAIVSIRRVGQGSATADVRMTFEPSPLFQEFEEALDQIQTPGLALSLNTRKQGKLVHVTFQHYEDGWHVENVE